MVNDICLQNIGSFIITLSALSTVLDAEEKTFFIVMDTRDATITNESSLSNLRFSYEKKRMSSTISIFGISFLMPSAVLFRVTTSGMLPRYISKNSGMFLDLYMTMPMFICSKSG